MGYADPFCLRGNFAYDELLRLIEDGSVALLHAPELSRDAASEGDPALLWTRWMLRLPSMNARQILEECLRIAAEQFANTSEADLPSAMEKEIARDLRRMQIQPAIMDNYRRFVVLKSKSDTYFADEKPGVRLKVCVRYCSCRLTSVGRSSPPYSLNSISEMTITRRPLRLSPPRSEVRADFRRRSHLHVSYTISTSILISLFLFSSKYLPRE